MTVMFSGGTFEVEWKGTMRTGETIALYDGTELTVGGVGLDAVADGMGVAQLFAVANATLHLHSLCASNSAYAGTAGGGGIAAVHSRVLFNSTNFVNNSAKSGGALCAVDGSDVFCSENIVFSGSVAATFSGAVFLQANLHFSCLGEAIFLNNSASESGGAFCRDDASTGLWNGETTLLPTATVMHCTASVGQRSRGRGWHRLLTTPSDFKMAQPRNGREDQYSAMIWEQALTCALGAFLGAEIKHFRRLGCACMKQQH